LLEEEIIEIEQTELPEDLTDVKIQTLADELGREFTAFDQPRWSLATEIWPACDRAYMAIRDDMPYIPTMKYVDNGMLGASDVRSAIKMARNQIIGGIIPADGSYLEPARDGNDDEKTLRSIRDMMLNKLDDAGIRDVMPIVVDQLLARGTSAIGLRWDTKKLVQKMDRQAYNALKHVADQMGVTDEDTGNPLAQRRGPVSFYKTIFEGPIIYPIDMYRLWLDPAQELNKDSDPSYIHLVFKTMSDLKGAVNDKGEKLYDHNVLKDVEELTYSQFYTQNPWACYSTKFMGIDPGLQDKTGKFVPVYLFYRQVRLSEDGEEKYVDKLFYVARSGTNNGWKIIRIQDNPHPMGHPPFFLVNCDSWLNTPYGTGIAEKSLSDLKALNVLRSIGLNYKVLQAFPPMFYFSGIFKNDQKPKVVPGGMQEIISKPGIGLEFMAPFPYPAQNTTVNLQDEASVASRILDQTGVTTAGAVSSPNKSVSKEKTAAEVKQESADDMSAQQVLVDKINAQMLQPFVQATYDLIRAKAATSATPVSYMSTDKQTGIPQSGQIDNDTINKDRQIRIVGRRGLASEAQKIGNLTEVLKILSNPAAAQVIANLPLMLQDVLIQLVSLLGVSMKPEYEMPPEEIFAKEPQVQQAALQNALQNPEMRIQIATQLFNMPEGHEFVKQLIEHIQGQMPTMPAKPPAGQMPAQPPAPAMAGAPPGAM
jgi:hypothetical protein